MTTDEALDIVSQNLLPEKILRPQVDDIAIPAIWGVIAAFVFAKANGVSAEAVAKEIFGG